MADSPADIIAALAADPSQSFTLIARDGAATVEVLT